MVATRLLLRNTIQTCTKQWNTESVICLVCTNMFLLHVWTTFRLLLKHLFLTPCTLTCARTLFMTSRHNSNFWNEPVAKPLLPQSCSPSRFLMTTTCKRPARIKLKHHDLHLVHHRADDEQLWLSKAARTLSIPLCFVIKIRSHSYWPDDVSQPIARSQQPAASS